MGGGQYNIMCIFQELLELAQRKFLRQLVSYTYSSETEVVFPRLFIIDYLRDEEIEYLRKQETEDKLREREEKRKAAQAAEVASINEKMRRLDEKQNRLKMFEDKAKSKSRRPKSAMRKDGDKDAVSILIG